MSLSVAAVFHRNGKLLLAKRVPGGSLSECWEFPGGKVEDGESAEEALVRELKEELEVQVQVGRCVAEGSFIHKGQERHLEAYLVECAESDLDSLVLHEHTETCWVSCREIADYNLADSDRDILPQVIASLDCTD